MNTFSSVLIIIVTWNKKTYVLDLLSSLKEIHYPNDKMDIVVVDNASTDDTVEAISSVFPDVHIIQNDENIGGTGGFNTGLSYAFLQSEGKYDYLWLLDNDVLVHPSALRELVAILDEEPDVAIAGSTMMQLDRPWRINEMGSFVDMGKGTLLHNRHLEDVKDFQGKTVDQLQQKQVDLSRNLESCKPSMDVEYVAAASLVIRAGVAKEAGLWDDYFIHYDDVEWCLRIARLGYRVVVSARSLIWHVSAEYKVPTWVLYYDNRNVLYMLEKHAGEDSVRGTIRWIKKKSLYYTLLGKTDLARLHQEALEDFQERRTGKKEIALERCYHPLKWVIELLKKPEIKNVLIPWTINLFSTDLQKDIAQVMKERPELHIDYLAPPPGIEKELLRQFPSTDAIEVPRGKIRRLICYLKLRNRYDLTFQSDYRPLLPLNITAPKFLFVNIEGVSWRQRTPLKSILRQSINIL